MELVASQLYGDKTHVEFNVSLTASMQKQLLLAARNYFLGLGIEGAECELERISGRGLLNILPNKALVIYADIGDHTLQGIVTVNRFEHHCVVSVYKQLLADEPFALNYNAEIRRRCVLNVLQDVTLSDYFFLLDRSFDVLWEFVCASVANCEGCDDQDAEDALVAIPKR